MHESEKTWTEFKDGNLEYCSVLNTSSTEIKKYMRAVQRAHPPTMVLWGHLLLLLQSAEGPSWVRRPPWTEATWAFAFYPPGSIWLCHTISSAAVQTLSAMPTIRTWQLQPVPPHCERPLMPESQVVWLHLRDPGLHHIYPIRNFSCAGLINGLTR